MTRHVGQAGPGECLCWRCEGNGQLNRYDGRGLSGYPPCDRCRGTGVVSLKTLTPRQRAFLVLAAEQPDGNPWPKLSMRDRSGGSMARMSERLVKTGLMARHNEINDAGRAAVKAEVERNRHIRRGLGRALAEGATR